MDKFTVNVLVFLVFRGKEQDNVGSYYMGTVTAY